MRLLSAFSKSVSQRYNCNRDSLSNFVDWQTSPISYIQPLGLLTSTDVTQRLVLAVRKSRDILVDYFNRTTTTKNHQLDREREKNVLFNDALNTFYLRLYGVRHMVKDHSDSEKGNPLPPHSDIGYSSINSKGSFICTIPQTG